MHGIVFVVYPGFELLDVSGPTSVFNGANRALTQRSKAPIYQITLVSAAGGSVASSSGVAVKTIPIIALSRGNIGTVLIVGGEREPLLAAVADLALREAVPHLTEIAGRFGSVCTGGFVLASLGLIDGMKWRPTGIPASH